MFRRFAWLGVLSVGMVVGPACARPPASPSEEGYEPPPVVREMDHPPATIKSTSFYHSPTPVPLARPGTPAAAPAEWLEWLRANVGDHLTFPLGTVDLKSGNPAWEE